MRPPRLYVVDPDVAGRDYEALDAGTGTVEEIRQAGERLRELAGDGSFTRPDEPVVVYRLASGAHQQTGVVVEVPVDDYRSGRVRRHEATRDDRVRELAELQEAAQLELVPVMLTHATRPAMQDLLAEAAAAEPDVRVASDDGLVQTVWVVREPRLARAIQEESARLDLLYIADGHHRFAVADRLAGRLSDRGAGRVTDFVLGALFPADEVRVLGYHRCVAWPGGLTAAELLDSLSAQPGVERVDERGSSEEAQPAPGVVPVYLDGGWYLLQLRKPDTDDPRGSLDVVVLEDDVLAPLLGVTEISSAAGVTSLPGSADASAVERWCTERRSIAFLLHPPGIDEVMAVSDAGLLMPPKSTWFDPKVRAGPFLRDLRC